MKNLKKVLALVLAFAMAFTMMATAGAAYTDQADIQATEAVEMLNALGVMTGDPDGSFRPNDTITRAEACRLIYSLRTGSEDASAYAGMQTTFTDVPADAWYAGYVKHCQSVGIVSGKSSTIFDPNANVTTVELALMCLRVMGYDPAKADIGGSTWSTATIGLATEAGILEDVNTSVTAACPRQWAAQLLYNTVDARTVRWSNDSETYTDLNMGGNKLEKVGTKYLKLNTYVGTLTSIQDDNLTINMSANDRLESDPVPANDGNKLFTKLSKDYTGLLGQKVKVMFKDGKTNSVLGVYATDDNTVYNTIMNNIEADGDKLKFDGASYSVNDTIATYVDGASVGDQNAAYFVNDTTANNVTLVDTDDDNKIDTAVIKTVDVQKVTYVSSSSIIAGGKTYKFADENIAEGLAKDDWVVISKNLFDDCKDIVKADMLQTTINGYKDDDGNSAVNAGDKYLIDGTWYDIATGADLDNANVKVGVTAKVVVVNGMIFYTKKVSGEGAVADLAFVVSKGDSIYGDQVKLMFLDGTTKVVTIDDDTTVDPVIGKFYEYTVTGEKYQFENITNSTEYGDYKYDNSKIAPDAGCDNISGTKVADSAKVIVWVNNTAGTTQDAKMITGKQFKTLTATDGSSADDNKIKTSDAIAFTSDVDGLTQISLAMVKFNNTAGTFGNNLDNLATNANYGYITSDAYKISNGYIQFTMWTGSSDETVKFKTTSTTDYVKGAVVGYDSLTDGEVKGLKKVTMYAGAITGVNSDGSKIVIDEKADQLKLDSDVTVLYVNSGADTDKGEEIGLASGSPEAAAKVVDVAGQATIYNTNILYNGDGINTTDIIVIDATGKFDNAVYAQTLTLTTMDGITVTDADGKILSSGDKVLKGDILTVKNTNAAQKTVTPTNAVDPKTGTANAATLNQDETATFVVTGATTLIGA